MHYGICEMGLLSRSDLTWMRGYQDDDPSNEHQATWAIHLSSHRNGYIIDENIKSIFLNDIHVFELWEIFFIK